MFQQITLIGNLGNDPEMRYTPDGTAVASFGLAVNKSWTSKDGQRHDKATWFRVTAWRKQAEIVSQYLTKGRQVMVIGEVGEPRAYVPKDGGEPRASLEVTAQVIKFLGQPHAASQNGAAPVAQTAATNGQPSEEEPPF